MHRRNTALLMAVGTVMALSATLISVPANAEPTTPEPSDAAQAPDPAPAAPEVAAGIIVKTKAGTQVAQVRAAVADAADAKVARTVPVDARTRAFVTPELVPLAEAQALADEIAARPDVEWAEPNALMRPTGAPWPVPVNDPLAPQLNNLWDSRDQAVSPWPAGGYSTKAPALWGATTGHGLVVAVLDTGIRENHPEFAGQLVTGFDVISDPLISNDGDGRDANASDPGDWTTSGYCGAGAGASNSSWHGTHVAGTIAAAGNNGIGIVGVAPGAKVQPVRVLGRCGGTIADIAAGVRWAAGVPVPGLPGNPTPAKILNMSLGGSGSCSYTFQSAIDEARGRGSSIFVALGNEDMDAAGASPANCRGVIGVASTTAHGDRAYYSNYGAPADISAPGGDMRRAGDGGILSTLDSGTTTPGAPNYVRYQGTSMATPAAAGVGALLYVLGEGRFTPDALEAAMRGAVTPFPTAGPAGFLPCTTATCGTGVLDATKVPVPVTPPVVVGTPRAGSTLTVSDPGAWLGAPTERTISWFVNNVFVGAGASYTIPKSTRARSIVAITHVAAGAFGPIGRTSAPVAVPGQRVVKRKSKIVVKGKRVVKARKKFKIKVVIKGRGVRRPTGVLRAYINGRLAYKGKITKKHRGRVRLRGQLSKRGRYRLKFVYSGSSEVRRSKKVVVFRAR